MFTNVCVEIVNEKFLIILQHTFETILFGVVFFSLLTYRFQQIKLNPMRKDNDIGIFPRNERTNKHPSKGRKLMMLMQIFGKIQLIKKTNDRRFSLLLIDFLKKGCLFDLP